MTNKNTNSQQQVKLIKVDRIQVEPKLFLRASYNEDAIQRYKELYEAGKTKPLIVQTKTFQLIDGFHRLKAVQELELEDIEVIEENIPDVELRTEAVRLNSEHGVSLSKVERDEVIKKLYVEDNKTQREIGELFHLSQRHIGRILEKDILSKTNNCVVKEWLLNPNVNQTELAKQYDITQPRVSQIIKEFKQEIKEHYQIGCLKEEIIKWIDDTYNVSIETERLDEILLEFEDLNPDLVKLPKLILGDYLQVAKNIPDDSVDLILTDPPYGIDYQSNFKNEKFEKIQSDEINEETIEQWIREMTRILKPNKHFYCFTSWKVYPIWFKIISKYLPIKNCLIIKKKHWGLGDLEYSFASAYDMIIFAQKGKKPFNITSLKEASESSKNDPRHTIDYTQRLPDLIDWINSAEFNLKMKHPTQKSIEICELLIQISSNPKEIVFDPFAGSGTTLVSARKLERNWLGIEIDKKWFDIALERIKTQGVEQ